MCSEGGIWSISAFLSDFYLLHGRVLCVWVGYVVVDRLFLGWVQSQEMGRYFQSD